MASGAKPVEEFLSTPSARRATLCPFRRAAVFANFYPRPPRGGRLPILPRENDLAKISIHALREEGDAAARRAGQPLTNFYPRPPRGGRLCGIMHETAAEQFLSTPSARRATTHSEALTWSGYDFYPRPPRGGRHGRRPRGKAPGDFYPRPPRGGRPVIKWLLSRLQSFLSTPSARRATHTGLAVLESGLHISIHALREEGDRAANGNELQFSDFYPRPPRGGRPRLF